jgi:hypothetical protein
MSLRVFFGCFGRPALVAVVEHDVPFWLIGAWNDAPDYDDAGEDIREIREDEQ